MNLKLPLVVSGLLIAGMVGLSAWAYAQLPAEHIATHFDINGQANGWSGRMTFLTLMPVIAIALTALFAVMPGIMPRKGSLERSEQAYDAAWLSSTGILAITHVELVLSAIGAVANPVQPILAGVGLLFMLLGNFLPKTRYNYMMGLRNPWTLADERVWDRTHRLAGPIMMTFGAVVLASVFLLPLPDFFWVMGGGVAIVVLVPTVYSWQVAKRLGVV